MSMEGDIERSRERAMLNDLRERGVLGREGWSEPVHPNQRKFVEEGWGGSHVTVPTDELPRRVPQDPESVRNEQEVRRAAAKLRPTVSSELERLRRRVRELETELSRYYEVELPCPHHVPCASSCQPTVYKRR